MPFCPKCKDEYIEGYTICSDCKADLVDVLPVAEPKAHREEYYVNDDFPVRLCSAADDTDASIIESLLNSYGIPVMKRRIGAGDFTVIYMGISTQGVDIFVPSKLLEMSKDILIAEPDIENNQISLENDINFELLRDKHEKIKRIKARILLIPTLLVIIAVLLLIVFEIIKNVLAIYSYIM